MQKKLTISKVRMMMQNSYDLTFNLPLISIMIWYVWMGIKIFNIVFYGK